MTTALWISLGTAGSVLTAMIVTWIKLKPEISQLRASTTKTQVEAAVAADAHEQKVLQNIIEAQITHLVDPLKDEVRRLSERVTTLERERDESRESYAAALRYIRRLHTWIARHLSTVDEPMPQPDGRLANDLL